MSFQDPIADMLTRIRNGQQNKILSIAVNYSKINMSILEVLKQEGYIADFDLQSENDEGKMIPTITVHLKYLVNSKPVIREITRISKPSRRVYYSIKDLREFYNGLGVYILTTSQGILSDKQARQNKIGGEVICSIF